MSRIRKLVTSYLSVINEIAPHISEELTTLLKNNVEDEQIVTAVRALFLAKGYYKEPPASPIEKYATDLVNKLCSVLNVKNSEHNAKKSPLLQLPDEMLLSIFGFFAKHQARQAGAACRRLHQISQDEKLTFLPWPDYNFPLKDKCIAVKTNFLSIHKPLICLLPKQKLATAHTTYEINIWDINEFIGSSPLMTLKGHSERITALLPLRDGKLASVDQKQIKIWDLNNPAVDKCIMTITDTESDLHSLIEMPCGKLVSIDARGCTIKVWDLQANTENKCIKILEKWLNVGTSLALTHDGKFVNCGEAINIWDLSAEAGNELVISSTPSTLVEHTGYMDSITVLPDGRLATGAGDGVIYIWDWKNPQSEECYQTLKCENDSYRIADLKVSPNGKLISISYDSTIRVWDLEQLCLQSEFITLENNLYSDSSSRKSLVVCPDGKIIASSSKGFMIHDFKPYEEEMHCNLRIR